MRNSPDFDILKKTFAHMENTSTVKSIITFPKPSKLDASSLNKAKDVVDEVPGFTMIQNYINEAEETGLWNELDKLPWVIDFSRKLQYYGYRNERTKPYHLVPIEDEIPSCLDFLMDRVMEDKLIYKRPEQVIINDYLPGQGIRPHFDRKDYFDNAIVGVSLGSDCVMEFTRLSDNHKVNVYVPRRSLYILEDQARYEWHHGIAGRKTDKLGDGKVLVRKRRISITFRNVIQDKVKRTNIVNQVTKALFKVK